MVRFCNAMLPPQITPTGSFLHIAVLHQRRGLFGRTRAKIEPHKRTRSDRTAPSHEFVRSELIGFDGIPSLFQDARAILFRSHAIQPVIARNKVAAGIADDRHSQVLHFFQNVSTKTIRIREFGARIVDAPVNRASKMFEEGPKEVSVDGRESAPGVEIDAHRDVCARRRCLCPRETTEHELGGAHGPNPSGLLQETSSCREIHSRASCTNNRRPNLHRRSRTICPRIVWNERKRGGLVARLFRPIAEV